MLYSIKEFFNFDVEGTDGKAGRVVDFLYDDEFWVCRYVVIDTGTLLKPKEVCIPMLCLVDPFMDENHQAIQLALTVAQIEQSPTIDDHETVSRRHEERLAEYYAVPQYWDGGDLWGFGPTPVIPSGWVAKDRALAASHDESDTSETHLRSSRETLGYRAHAKGDDLGSVVDMFVGSNAWQIRRFLVDLNSWLPGGLVPIEAEEIDEISWSDKQFKLSVSKHEIKGRAEVDRAIAANVEA